MTVGHRLVVSLTAALFAAGCGAGSRAQVEQTSRQISALKRQASELRVMLAATEKRTRALAGQAKASGVAMADVKEALESSGISVSPRGASVVVTLASRVLFGAGKTQLQPEARSELIEIGKILSERFADRPIAVEGHSDSSPTNKIVDLYPTNWELSAARAVSVLRCLVEEGGVSADKVHMVAYADNRPIADNESIEGRAENRRVEIVVLPPIETTTVSATFE